MKERALLQARNLVKEFKIESETGTKSVVILEGINLEIYPGETLAITGASGEGKSTLLHLLGLLEEPSSGEIIYPHWPFANADEIRKKHISFIFQQFLLLEDLTVYENIMLPIRLFQSRKIAQAKEQAAKELLERVGLGARIFQAASKLSGGEKQRLAIARALVGENDLLFADEPTGNLDHDNAQLIAELLFDIVREKQRALVLVTHEQKLAQRADRWLKLEKGVLSNRA